MAHQDVHDADLLVIDRGGPIVQRARPAEIGGALDRRTGEIEAARGFDGGHEKWSIFVNGTYFSVSR